MQRPTRVGRYDRNAHECRTRAMAAAALAVSEHPEVDDVVGGSERGELDV